MTDNNGWTDVKPKADHEFILITANWFKDYWGYSIFTIEKVDGFNQNGEECWYYGILDNGEEWGDYEDLISQKYLQLPLLNKK